MKTLLLTAVILCGLIGSVVAQKKNTVLGDFVTGVGAATDEPVSEITTKLKLRDDSRRELHQQHSPLLKGVDHFFATSSEPEVLLKFFREVLGLPQVWAFNNFARQTDFEVVSNHQSGLKPKKRVKFYAALKNVSEGLG